MEGNQLNILTLKLKRLHVKHEIIDNNSILIKGTLLKGNLFYMIIMPILLLVLFFVLLGILTNTPEIERIRFPLIILILPILVFYLGIKSFLRLKKSRKQSFCIKKGSIELIDKKGNKKTIVKENIQSIDFKIEENETSFYGEISLIDTRNKAFLLISIMDNNGRLLKDDLEYIKDVFKMIIFA